MTRLHLPPLARRLHHIVAALTIALFASSLVTACSSGTASTDENLPAIHTMPMEVQQAERRVQQAYQLAVAHPETLQSIPCYCGCVDIGHKNNYECYVEGVSDAGEVTYDLHAVYCLVCVDITHDAVRLLGQGESPEAIRAYIDANYARFGAPTVP